MNSSRRLIAPERATTESSPLIRACAAVAAALADVNAAVSSRYGWWSTRTRPSEQASGKGVRAQSGLAGASSEIRWCGYSCCSRHGASAHQVSHQPTSTSCTACSSLGKTSHRRRTGRTLRVLVSDEVRDLRDDLGLQPRLLRPLPLQHKRPAGLAVRRVGAAPRALQVRHSGVDRREGELSVDEWQAGDVVHGLVLVQQAFHGRIVVVLVHCMQHPDRVGAPASVAEEWCGARCRGMAGGYHHRRHRCRRRRD